MPSSPIPAPPPIDSAAGTPSLRTLGTGARQAAAGTDSRLEAATAVSSGIVTAGSQALGGAKTFQGVATPLTVSGNDDTGTAPTMAVNNPGVNDGKPQISLEIAGTEAGSIYGHDSLEAGLVDGLTITAPAGREIGFRVNGTNVGRVTDLAWTIPVEINVIAGGIRFPDGSLQAVAAGGSQWTEVDGDLSYASGNVGLGSLVAPTAILHLTTNGLGHTNPFIRCTDSSLAGAEILISDATGVAGHFMPRIHGKAIGSTASTARGLQLIGEPGTDHSDNAAVTIHGRLGTDPLVTSHVLEVYNHTTRLASIGPAGHMLLGAGTPGAWLDINRQARLSGPALLRLLDTDAGAGHFTVTDAADTVDEWQPLLHVKASAAGTGKTGFTTRAEPPSDHNANPAMVITGSLGGVALDQSPILELKNLTTLRSRISHNGEQYWWPKIQGGIETGQASIGTSGNTLGLNFQDTGGDSRTDIRHLAGGGLTFHAHAGNAAPPELMRLDATGQLGIGGTPTKTLDVKSATAQDGTIQLQATATTSFNGVHWLDEAGNSDFMVGIGGSAVTQAGGQSISANARNVITVVMQNNTPLRWYGRASETGGTGLHEQLEILGTNGDWNWYQGLFRIDRSTRNIGVNLGDSTMPSQSLHVNGNIRVSNNDDWLGIGDNDNIRWNTTTTPTGANTGAAGYVVLNSRGNMILNFDSDNNVTGINQCKFGIYSNKTTSVMTGSLFMIQEDGAVGIGVDAPTERLQVQGMIHSTSSGFKFPDATIQQRAVIFGDVLKRRGDSMLGTMLVDVQGHSLTDFSRGSWRLNESNAGAGANDAMGAYPLSVTGSPTLVDGKFGSARGFAGAAYLSGAADSTSANKVKAENWTWGAWVQPMTIDGDHGVFSVGHSDNSNSLFFVAIKNSDNKVYIGNSDQSNGTTASCPALQVGKWYHLLVTRASGNFRLYVNGVDTGTIAVTNSALAPAAPTWFVATCHLGNFKGTIDDVWFEDREVTGSEALAEYLSTYQLRVVGDVRVGGDLETQAGRRVKTRVVSRPSEELDATDHVVLADTAAAAGPITLTLPLADEHQGRIYIIKKIDASSDTVDIDPSGSAGIDGSSSHTLVSQYDSVTIVSDGIDWHII
jgi:hypothetical protein